MLGKETDGEGWPLTSGHGGEIYFPNKSFNFSEPRKPTKGLIRGTHLEADKATAVAILQDWVDRATASGIRMLVKFAKTIALYRRGILAYYDYPISTGPLEGTNNKIKTMKRQAYGFRDQEFFKLKILALHETRYALVG